MILEIGSRRYLVVETGGDTDVLKEIVERADKEFAAEATWAIGLLYEDTTYALFGKGGMVFLTWYDPQFGGWAEPEEVTDDSTKIWLSEGRPEGGMFNKDAGPTYVVFQWFKL